MVNVRFFALSWERWDDKKTFRASSYTFLFLFPFRVLFLFCTIPKFHFLDSFTLSPLAVICLAEICINVLYSASLNSWQFLRVFPLGHKHRGQVIEGWSWSVSWRVSLKERGVGEHCLSVCFKGCVEKVAHKICLTVDHSTQLKFGGKVF